MKLLRLDIFAQGFLPTWNLFFEKDGKEYIRTYMKSLKSLLVIAVVVVKRGSTTSKDAGVYGTLVSFKKPLCSLKSMLDALRSPKGTWLYNAWVVM